MPKRILFVEGCEDGTVGGSHQALFDLARHLDTDRYEPVVLFLEENRFADRLCELGVAVHVWKHQRDQERRSFRRPTPRMRYAVAYANAVRRRVAFLRRERIALLHVNNSPNGGSVDWLPAALLVRIPTIASVLGLYPRVGHPFKRWLSHRWTLALACSRYVEDHTRNNGFPSKRIRTIHLSVDITAFLGDVNTQRSVMRGNLGVHEHQMMIAAVGNIRRWKGQRVLLEALAHLDEDSRDRIRALVVGGTATQRSSTDETEHDDLVYLRELHRFVESNHLEKCVTFLGPRTDVPDIMNASDVVVHTSVIPEPFGLVVVEGMALGRAVVAAKTGGPAEIITPGSGLTFDPSQPRELADHLRRLLCEPDLRRQLGTQAKERARVFDIGRRVEGTQAVYSELLAGG